MSYDLSLASNLTLATYMNGGATWDGIEALDTANDDAYKPQLAFDSKDKAIVVWGFVKGRYDDTVSGIRATRHKSSRLFMSASKRAGICRPSCWCHRSAP